LNDFEKEKNRMKSSKWMIGLVAVVLMLTLAPSSFAQIQIQLFNTPSPREVETSRNAVTADPFSPGAGILVSGQLIANSSLTTTDLTLTFPAPITAGVGSLGHNIPNALEAIRIEGAIGLFASATISTVNYSAGTLTLTLPGFPPPAGNTQSGSFRVVGVRLDLASRTAPLSLTSAVLSSNANNYIAPTSMPSLITSFGAGISGMSLGTAGTFSLFTTPGSAPIDAAAAIVISEGFASAWRTATQNTTSGNSTNMNGTNIRLTIAGMPAGVIATLTPAAASATVPAVTLSSATLTSTTLTTTLTLASTDMNVSETIPIAIAITGSPTATLAAGASITLTASLVPNPSGTGASAVINSTTGLPTAGTSGFPKYTASEVPAGALVIGSTIAAKTTMLIPYAVRIGTAFDTGIAIANTTKDPFTVGAAVETDGPITFYLFPRTGTGAGTEASASTAAVPGTGTGLNTAGALVTGGTWTGLLSQVMAAATPATTGDFVGYVFIETNFLDAHGVAYLIQGTTITSGLPILVLQQPAVTARNTTLESLSF
jgi:hypothetical protein